MKFFILFAALIGVSFASLAKDIRPVLAAVAPVTTGLDAGLQQGAGNLKAAVQNVGAALNQVAHTGADVAADTAAGLGQTLGLLPGHLDLTVHNLDTGNDLIGSLLRTLFGGRQ